MISQPRIRPVARVLLLDDQDRVLLIHAVGMGGIPFWFPTGGGLEAGETAEQAAIREVAEETGLQGVKLDAEIWHRKHKYDWFGELVEVRERWFMSRVPAFEISTDSWTETEKRIHTSFRWWTLEELKETTDNLTPRRLAEFLSQLLKSGPPTSPFDVGV